jgi:hypothetical protein
MNEHFDEPDEVVDENEDAEDEVDRAPQPGNTPAPDETPRTAGGITGREEDADS